MKRIIGLVVPAVVMCAVLPGCFGDTLGINYNIVYDPAFSDADKTYIRSAAQSWKDILGDDLNIMSITEGSCNAGIDPTIGSSPPGNLEMPDPGTMRQMCFHAITGAWLDAHGEPPSVIGLTYRHAPEDSADIFLPVDRDATLTSAAWTETAAHELGHGMGLEHISNDGGNNIMYWELDGVPVPTCDDAAEYLSLRHQSTITPQCQKGGFWSYYH